MTSLDLSLQKCVLDAICSMLLSYTRNSLRCFHVAGYGIISFLLVTGTMGLTAYLPHDLQMF